MINIPLPRLLDSSGQTAGFIRPIRESITQTLTPLSYATMELPVGEEVPARSFVELYTANGSAGVFRVRAPQDAYGEDITVVELEHAIVEVGDWLILANLEGSYAASTAMQTVFSHYRGSHWQLGSVSALTGTVNLQAGYSRILDVMLDIVAKCEGCMLSFDFSSHPWTVSVTQKGSSVAAEGRLGRNISSARISYDDTDLCTRAYYPIPSTNAQTGEVTHTWGYVDADTISTYGVSERAVYDENDLTAAECLATAQKYLDKYKRPKFSVQITGEELSARTGEALDTFVTGKLFRLALADYGVTVDENITVLSWEDVYGSPTAVDITLAEEETDTASYLHDLDVYGSTVSSGDTKDVEQKVSKIYSSRTVNNEVDLVKIKANASGEILSQAGLSIDPVTGVLIYADDFEQNIGSKFNVQANRIGMVVGTYQGQDYIKAGEIALAINNADESVAHIDADHVNISATSTLHTLAGAIEEDDQGNVTIKSAGGMRVRKTVSGQVAEFGVFDENSLTAGVMVQKINGQSTAHLNADNIYIGNQSSVTVINGKAEVTELNAVKARISTIESDYIQTTNLSSAIASLTAVRVSSISGTSADFNVGEFSTLNADSITVANGSLTLGNTPLSTGNLVKSVVGSPVTGGGYKFTVTQANGSSQDYSFNVATSVVLSGVWSGTTYTATAKDPDDNVLGTVATTISKEWIDGVLVIHDENDTELITQAFSHDSGTGTGTGSSVTNITSFDASHRAYGRVLAGNMVIHRFQIDASGEYTAGNTAGYAEGRLEWRPDSITQNIGDKTVTVLNSAGDTLATYSVQTTYSAGETAGHTAGYAEARADWRPDRITQDTANKQITVLNSSGDSIGTYSVQATYTAGVNSVTLTEAAWQSGNKVITASNGETVTVTMPAVTLSDSSWSGHKKTVYAYSSAAGITGYIAHLEVDATSEYNAGSTAGYTTGYSEARTEWRPNSISQDTTNKQITVLNSAGDSIGTYSVLTTYNAGVTAGEAKFSKAALTLQGTAETITPIGALHRYSAVPRYKGDGGTVYARGNTQAAYIGSSTGSYYLRGSSINRKYSGTLYTIGSHGEPISQGNGNWFLASQDTLYLGNGARLGTTTLYKGDGGTYVARGTSETVYVSDASGAVYLYSPGTAVTRYQAGTSYTADTSPYYTKTS